MIVHNTVKLLQIMSFVVNIITASASMSTFYEHFARNKNILCTTDLVV